MTVDNTLLVILGPTATGKTRLAALVASRIGGEIISADSRQVYRGMDIGTGKDYGDYEVDGKSVPYHLIDIADPGYKYNVFEFQRDFLGKFGEITRRGNVPVLCGGTGMYIDAVVRGYKLLEVPENEELRKELGKKDIRQLAEILRKMRPLHNITDITDIGRAIRAIEIETFYRDQTHHDMAFPKMNICIAGISFPREVIRRRITSRLEKRLGTGMISEVKGLLGRGISKSDLSYYGLEYRYVTDYLAGETGYDEMFRKLNTAIHAFAKRQMTWFRRMEKKGLKIHWVDGSLPEAAKVEEVVSLYQRCK